MDPNKPKRPTSAYFFFVAKQREELEKQGRKITRVAEWTKEVSLKWKALTEKERAPFDAKAQVDKERYDSQMLEYKGKDPNKPKRPQSSYFLWLADFREENKEKFPENKRLLQAAGEKWRELTPPDKEKYELMAKEEKRKYEIALREYAASGGAAAAKQAAAVAPPPPMMQMGAAGDAKNGSQDNEDDEEDDEEEEEDYEEDDE